MIKTLIFFIILSIHLDLINGHGYLADPPSRSSAWRFGFQTLVNDDDNALNCGGFGTQWIKNKGNCGPCGDNWAQPEPRPNELNGKYGTGVIVKKYTENQAIMIKINIDTNHLGYFEFRLCPHPENSTQECFDRYLLQRRDKPGKNKYFIGSRKGIITMVYQLPEGLTCNHCVLQWIYRCGNNWGLCEDGTEEMGCGPQEEFRNCADISIGKQNNLYAYLMFMKEFNFRK